MNTFQKPISYMFLVYFLVLTLERIQSLSRSFRDSNIKMFSSSFDIYVNSIAMVSLISFLVLIVFYDRGFWRSLVADGVNVDYPWLSIISGVLLVSGMVHTEYTIPPLQFVAYASLIVAMILRTVVNSSESINHSQLWYSLIYSIVFSMAIPVVYRSEIRNAPLFHIVEALVSLFLVGAFTIMLRSIFLGKGEDLLCLIPFLVAMVGDAVILAMRWKESVNMFLLIFSSLMTLMFILGKILFQKS